MFADFSPAILAWMAAVNLLSCVLEGGFGFLGSLTFLALTVPVLGWPTALFADAMLACTNLVFAAWINRDSVVVRRVARGWAFGLPAVLAGTLVFDLLPTDLRVLPIAAVGAFALWRVITLPRRVLPVLAGLGVGFGNTEDPFGYLYFQSQTRRVGDNALFGAGLLGFKVAVMVALWREILLPDPTFLVFLALTGLPATLAGRRFLGRWAEPTRRRFVRWWVPSILLFLLLGVLHARQAVA